MSELLLATAIFACLVGASLGSLRFHNIIPARYRNEETHVVVRSLANIFVVLTSLMLGLSLNASKTAYEAVNGDVHALATEIILLDRTLRAYGADAEPARQDLIAYARRASDGAWTNEDPKHDPLVIADRGSERMLDTIDRDLEGLAPADPRHAAILDSVRQTLQNVVRLRWTLLEKADSAIPQPLLILMTLWLMLIFASFGFRAPRNVVTGASFIVSAALIAGALYLILDMDAPFSGPIQISTLPLKRAYAEIGQ